MKNLLKMAIVFVSLGSQSFDALSVEAYGDLDILYFAAPLAVAIFVGCLSSKACKNDIEELDQPSVANPEAVLQRFQVSAQQAENLIWQAMDHERIRDEERVRRVMRENERLSRRVPSCRSSRTGERKS